MAYTLSSCESALKSLQQEINSKNTFLNNLQNTIANRKVQIANRQTIAVGYNNQAASTTTYPVGA